MADSLFESIFEVSSVSSSELASLASSHGSSESAASSEQKGERRRGPGQGPPNTALLEAIPLTSTTEAPRLRLPSGRLAGVARAVASVAFFVAFLLESFGRPRLTRLARLRLGRRSVEVEGLEHLPKTGGFVLATNHYRAGCTFDVLAAVVEALGAVRDPDEALIVSGQRAARSSGRLSRLLRGLGSALLSRWSRNLIRIPLDNEMPSARSLRGLMRGAETRATIVFPEGRTSLELDDVRAGAGQMLSAIRTATLPVAVFETDRGLCVRIGQRIAWAPRPLCDLQLGLAMAALLPRELAPDWQDALVTWRSAHASPSS